MGQAGIDDDHLVVRRREIAVEPDFDPAGDRETDFVQSLQRGIAVIRAFDANTPPGRTSPA